MGASNTRVARTSEGGTLKSRIPWRVLGSVRPPWGLRRPDASSCEVSRAVGDGLTISPIVTCSCCELSQVQCRSSVSLIKDFVNETSTLSRLKFKPSPEDHNVTMRCRADNVLLSASIDDAFEMNVVYKPVVHLSLGSTLHPNEIKEGDDVYFECNIKANPKEYRISWYHDTGIKKLINKTPRRQGGHIKSTSAGIFISTKSLVLQKVDRTYSGFYSCVAANEMGETSSSEIFLRIQFAPVCSQPSPMVIGARIDEQLRIRCTVRADPADVSFVWLFNISGESYEVSPHRYGPNIMMSAGGTASELRYQASSERDYGSLTCLTKNTVGGQNVPCIFQIVPATRPFPPRNCTVSKVARHREPLLAIRCEVGFDGGTRQHFTLETTGNPSRLLVNTSAGYPGPVVWLNVTWSVFEDIPEDQNLVVTAHNSKGPSEPVIIELLNFREPSKKIAVTAITELNIPSSLFLSHYCRANTICLSLCARDKAMRENRQRQEKPC
ncbi:immunoglobulin domain-containing protein [Phthorimaea operculella]|nr:immunoglobulin domain-containing protein [Phthorimaea operculella]